jgi:ribosomal protein S18 acetylase RimI-like enzyme
MPDATIRTAGPEDAAVLAALGRDTFVDTFAHLYPPQDLAAFLAQSYTPEAFDVFLGRPDQAMWIAETGGEAIGYAHAGACALPHPDVTHDCRELKRLYVRKGGQGGGLGGRLIAEALGWMAAPGRSLWIGVWSENHGAQRFYARHGFEKVGEYEFIVGETRDREFILRRG